MKKVLITLMFLIVTVNSFASGSVLLNGKTIKTKQDLHKILAKDLHFPKFYGNNLDALFDTLVVDVSGETIIKLKFIDIMKKRLGTEYVDTLIETLSEAADENAKVIIVFE